jgi:hypothetical protein
MRSRFRVWRLVPADRCEWAGMDIRFVEERTFDRSEAVLHVGDFPYNQEILSLMQQRYLTSIPGCGRFCSLWQAPVSWFSWNSTTVAKFTRVRQPRAEDVLSHFVTERLRFLRNSSFEVEDGILHRYIVGQRPEAWKDLGVFDCKSNPHSRNAIEKLGTGDSALTFPIGHNVN